MSARVPLPQTGQRPSDAAVSDVVMMTAYRARNCPTRSLTPEGRGKESRMTAARDGAAQRMLRRVDAAQRNHTVLAFPFAVIKKFTDDRASQLAALIAYYGFFSLFPLLLVFATVASYVIKGNRQLRERLLNSVVEQFPVVGRDIGDTIDESVRQLSDS